MLQFAAPCPGFVAADRELNAERFDELGAGITLDPLPVSAADRASSIAPLWCRKIRLTDQSLFATRKNAKNRRLESPGIQIEPEL